MRKLWYYVVSLVDGVLTTLKRFRTHEETSHYTAWLCPVCGHDVASSNVPVG